MEAKQYNRLTLFENGEVFVNTQYLLELTESEEFKAFDTGLEFSESVTLAINLLEEVVKTSVQLGLDFN